MLPISTETKVSTLLYFDLSASEFQSQPAFFLNKFVLIILPVDFFSVSKIFSDILRLGFPVFVSIFISPDEATYPFIVFLFDEETQMIVFIGKINKIN